MGCRVRLEISIENSEWRWNLVGFTTEKQKHHWIYAMDSWGFRVSQENCAKHIKCLKLYTLLLTFGNCFPCWEYSSVQAKLIMLKYTCAYVHFNFALIFTWRSLQIQQILDWINLNDNHRYAHIYENMIKYF